MIRVQAAVPTGVVAVSGRNSQGLRVDSGPLLLRLLLLTGLLLGTGVGCGFLAKGLIAPGVIGLAGLLLPTS